MSRSKHKPGAATPKRLNPLQRKAIEDLMIGACEDAFECIEDSAWSLDEGMEACAHWGHLAEALERLGVRGAALNLAKNTHLAWQRAIAEEVAFEQEIRDASA